MRSCYRFLLVATLFAPCLYASPFEVSREASHQEAIQSSAHRYTIQVGGTADMDRSSTRDHGNWAIAFQNNVELRIENTGASPVKNPRVIINDRGRWHSWESMLAEFCKNAQTDQERIYAIYDGLRQHRHHDYPLFSDDEYHDPVRFLNIYGGGFCDDSGKCGSALFHQAGFSKASGGKDPFVRALHGHMMCEVWHEGDYQFMDIDQDTFYLDRENKKPVSGDTVARDHDYAKREQVYGPAFQPWNVGPHNAAALFGIDDDRSSKGVWGHSLDYTLRPGETYVFRWDNVGKYPWKREDKEHRYYGNSRIEYVPLAKSNAFDHVSGFEFEGRSLLVTKQAAQLEILTKTPYTLCGAAVSLCWRALPEGGRCLLELADRKGDFHPVWESRDEAQQIQSIPLDEALQIAGQSPRRSWRFRLSAEKAQGLEITKLRIISDLYAYPIALPRLQVGENIVEYSDETEAKHAISIRHQWLESENIAPPTPPSKPIHPEHCDTIQESFITFEWPEVPDCEAYHLFVSKSPDCRFSYRPNYDLILKDTSYRVPYRGMFSHDETYYWRIRPRQKNGLWGAWSPIWAFSWAGPMVPKKVRLEEQKGALVLRWEANPLGTAPVSYDIYASNERGFSISKEAYELPVIGKQEANFLGNQKRTQMMVGGAFFDNRKGNRAFYRVVAIDAHGVESCPSDYAEVSRPFVYSNTLSRCKVGQEYRYPLRSIRCIGDLQYRYLPPGQEYWEKEATSYHLFSGPSWLKLNEESGLLQGLPTAEDRGDHAIAIALERHYPQEVPAESKSGKAFQKRRNKKTPQVFHRFTLRVE